MKVVYYLLIISLLIISGCAKTGYTVLEQGDVVESSESLTYDDFGDEEVNCDDNNECTDDVISEGKCLHNLKKPCCGNQICENNEGCNSLTYKTGCVADCGVRCQPKLALSSINCEGSCTSGSKSIDFTGPGKIKFSLINLGENPLFGVKAELKCENVDGKTTYSGYFNSNSDTLDLQTRETGYYYINFKRSDEFILDCDITFTSDYTVIFDEVKITGK